MSTEALPELDAQYRVLRESVGLLDRSDRGKLLVHGPEAAEYLQSQLTNDVEALEPGRGCYAALLDRKGHIEADMRVLLLSTGDFWIDTEAAALEKLRDHLETYKIGREVELADESGDWAILSLIGPGAYELAATAPLSPENAQRDLQRNGIDLLAVGTDLGLDLIARAGDAAAVRDLLLSEGAAAVSEQAAEILRIESGRPRFGREMSAATMPAETGIEERAIDFEKGCYIGQEPVARLHYKGRPNRTLRGLKLSAPAPAGAALRLGDKELGTIGSSCVSPAAGPIALAIVRREAEPGDTIAVGADGVSAEIVELPFLG